MSAMWLFDILGVLALASVTLFVVITALGWLGSQGQAMVRERQRIDLERRLAELAMQHRARQAMSHMMRIAREPRTPGSRDPLSGYDSECDHGDER